MQKTLGGDRLGSGKKMKVELHNYERSTHDLGYLWRSTMSMGTLVPFMHEIALPGDTFDINLECEILTHPTIGPLFGSAKVQLDVFEAPIRLYQALLHNNSLNIGRNMSQVLLPQIVLTATDNPDGITDIDNTQINPSSIMAYLGVRGVGTKLQVPGGTQGRSFNALGLLSYWDIYKNYYANKQEEIGAVIHTPIIENVETIDQIELFFNTSESGIIGNFGGTPSFLMTDSTSFFDIAYTGAVPRADQIMLQTDRGDELLSSIIIGDLQIITPGQARGTYNWAQNGQITVYTWRYITRGEVDQSGQPQVATFPLTNIDDMRNLILGQAGGVVFEVNNYPDPPYSWVYGTAFGSNNLLQTQEGLAIKTYQSDLFNNWLSTEWIDGPGGITEITAISTVGDSFTLDTLNLSKKVYNMLNRIAVSGGSYDDWLDAVYVHDRYQRCESPMYMGGLIKELIFQEVVSNSASTTEGPNGSQPLGTLAGRGKLGNKHKGGHVTIKVDEPSIILGIISITPRIDYSQGNKWDVHLRTMDDLHKPALDEIGFQELITEQMAWWDTTYNETTDLWEQKSAGKQPAWINYMTNVNRNYGNFAIANNEMFMTFNRRYESSSLSEPVLSDLTTYIDPVKFNYIFAETALDAQNFWTQIAVDITARRKMSAKLMPNL